MNALKIDKSKIIHVEKCTKQLVIPPWMRDKGYEDVLLDIPEHYEYRDLIYVAKPIDPSRQFLNVFIPAEYIDGKSCEGYTAETAPVFYYVQGGAFWAHKNGELDEKLHLYNALKRGFVVISVNYRGCRDKINVDGKEIWSGLSPAEIVDLKAGIRFLRYNKDILPGNYEKIIIQGVSSGGALVALLATSGNTKRFQKYFEELGACEERDDVFVCGSYCGPTDLSIIDMAYDWVFGRFYYKTEIGQAKGFRGEPIDKIVAVTNADGMPVIKINYVKGETAYDYYDELAKLFVDKYIVETLHLTEKEYILRYMRYLLPAYTKYRAENPEKCREDYFYFSNYKEYCDKYQVEDPYFDTSIFQKDSGYINFDLFRVFTAKSASKFSPAFDKLKINEMYQTENALFGSTETGIANFTKYGAANGEMLQKVLSEDIKKRVIDQNAMSYIGDKDCNCVKHWRLRHGTLDGDIPIVLSVDITELLKANGISDIYFEPVINGPHGCDDGEEIERFFDWCAGCCVEE